MKPRSRIQYGALIFLLAIIYTLSVQFQAASAGTIYRVIPGGKTSGACGDDWENGCELNYALTTLAVSGDELWVKRGTYKPTGSELEPRRNSINLKAGVSIYGGFAGTETERAQRDWQANLTVLSGDLNGDDGPDFANITDNSFHVVKSNNVGAATILDGFTIRGGNATSPNIQEKLGGGMYLLYDCPTLNNLQIISNAAQDDGGGMYALCTNLPVFSNLTFSGNRAGRKGGGLYNNYYDQLGHISINGAAFENNYAASGGGGIYNYRANSTLSGVRFTNNSSNFGGGLMIESNTGSSFNLTNIIFEGNSATETGGGFYAYTSSPSLANVIFTGNDAVRGGGMGNYASQPVLTNVSFSGNDASKGGAIYNFGSPSVGSQPLIRNSLLWGDTGGEVYNEGANNDSIITYSIVQGCYPSSVWNPACGTDGGHNLADANPRYTDAAAGDLRIGTDSPALHKGNNDFVEGISTDLDGKPRINGKFVDLGAYEYQGQKVYRVIPGGKKSVDCGNTWANGCDLQYALTTRVIAGDQLWVKRGLYIPTTTGDRNASFVLKNHVLMYGGFDGGETDLGQRDWQTNQTVLSGDLSSNDGPDYSTLADNSYHVVRAEGVDAAAILAGFTIQGGNADGTYPDNYGGGIYNLSSSATLFDLIITGNNAANLGGGAYISGNPRLTNVTFSGNKASYGAGIANAGNPWLVGVIFNDNSAAEYGGGLYNYNQSQANLYNCLIFSNTARRGAGIYNTAGSPRLYNSTFWDNVASESGSGMYSTNGSTPFVQNSIFWGDREAGGPGGEIRSDSAGGPSIASISYSLVSGCNPEGVWNSDCGANGGHNLADADPQFVDPDHANFRLPSSSPGIDAGSDDPYGFGLQTDLNGDPRWQGTHLDLGPYELKLIYTDQRATGANDGSSWADAFTDLQSALASATQDSEIWVAEGIYKPSSSGSQGDRFQLENGVMIYGGFSGTETALDQRDWDAYKTILSGDLNGDDGPGFTNMNDNSDRVLETYTDANALLDGFTITGGNQQLNGGGLYIDHGSMILRNLTFTHNMASSGGGLYNWGAALTVSNTVFIENMASDAGGGLHSYEGTVTASRITITDNTAGVYGGGMSAQGSLKVQLDQVVFAANASGYYGGGLALNQANAEIRNSVFYGNSAPGGGGIDSRKGSELRLINTTFFANTAEAGMGGGILNRTDGVAKNSLADIRNSILWGDEGGEVVTGTDEPLSTTRIAYSLVQGCNSGGAWNPACGENGGHNLADADPQFVNAALGNLRLRRSSPARDQGDNLEVEQTHTDLDGSPRILNKVVDLGAYEYQNYPPQATGFKKSCSPGQEIFFTQADFTGNFSDPNADELVYIQIITLPDQGALYLGGSPVTQGQEISVGSIGNLYFIPPRDWAGVTSFEWTGSDGEICAVETAAVTLTIISNEYEVFLPAVIR